MRSIELNNFRCYDNLKVDFGEGINLVIGDNASGKTSLLQACKYALSSFFAGFSDENTKWVAPSASDFKTVYGEQNVILNEKEIIISFSQGDIFEGSQGDYSIVKRSKKNSRALTAGIADYKRHSAKLFKTFAENKAALPLFACFTTEDIHSKRKISEKQFLSYNQKPSFGYIECLECNGLMNYWQKRLLILKEAEKNVETDIVCHAIEQVLGQDGCGFIDKVLIRPNKKKIFYKLLDGREIESDYLSDGYKRLVNIVTDIAFRCALLNRYSLGNDCVSETKGTVLIDEIDMHLHPMLQTKVLKSLRATFQNLQFIVTTHAPMVMTGVVSDQNNMVYKLSFKAGEYFADSVRTYGLDASKIIQLILDVVPRDAAVDKELKSLFEDIDERQFDSAVARLNELKKQFGDLLPELTQAQAMLDFLAMTA